MIRHSKAFDTYMVMLISSSIHPLLSDYAVQLHTRFPRVASVYSHCIHEKKGSPTQSHTTLLAGTPFIYEKINHLPFKLSPLSFFQTNSFQVNTLYQCILDHCHLTDKHTVLDLYCGTGTIGLSIAHTFHCQLIGIEENDAAILDARENALSLGIPHTTFYSGRVKNILKFHSFNPDLIVIDPPRCGMVPKALQRVIDLHCSHILYVSCNPVSLLRDLKYFTDSDYQVTSFIPIDMFPHTYHLECLISLERVVK